MQSICEIERYTYSDYKKWEGDWELIEGTPIAMAPAPMIKHQKLASRILIELGNEIEECENCAVIGEEDWKIKEDTVVRPDVVLICDEEGEEYITKAPEIVVEVVSKSTANKDENYKFYLYEKEKVPFYILLYPDDCKAKIYKLKNGKYEKEGDFFKENYTFKDIACKDITVNFEKVFKRCKKG